LELELRERGLNTKGKNKRELVELCEQHQIAITKTVAKVKEGWEGKAKGLLQVLWERGLIDGANLKQYSLTGKKDDLGTVDTGTSLRHIMGMCNDCSLSSIRTAVLDSVDIEDLPTLSALIPNLNRIVCAQGNSRASGRSNQDQAYAKLLATVCSFVRSVIATTSPTVIFLDDLQFASDASIDLVQALATDVSIRGMLLVLTYRSEEVKCDSSLQSFINTMLFQPPTTIRRFVILRVRLR
jgi:predicted ATPase